MINPKIGSYIKYTGQPCPKCGRYRLELYTSGLSICEKCLYCVEEQRYIPEDELDLPEPDWHFAEV